MLKINKFGGSILKNSNDIKLISKVILENRPSINVFSAFYKVTDALISITDLARNKNIKYKKNIITLENFHKIICQDLEIDDTFIKQYFIEIERILDSVFQINDLSDKTLDSILVFGELLSSKMIYEYISTQESSILFIDSRQVFKTDSSFGKANIDLKLTINNLKNIEYKRINIFAGFIASDLENNSTTLGRNGSDYTASLIASIIDSKELITWKDVDGVFTADPKIVSNAIHIKKISYSEMEELSYFGNKVIALKALKPAISRNIPVHIRNIYNIKNSGTTINNETEEKFDIKGITKIDTIIFEIISYNMTKAHLYKKLMDIFSIIELDFLFISHSSCQSSISFGIKDKNFKIIKNHIEIEFANELNQELLKINIKENQSMISIIGKGILNKPGISSKIFNNLEKENININTVSTGLNDINISFVVNAIDSNLAIRILHSSIFNQNQK